MKRSSNRPDGSNLSNHPEVVKGFFMIFLRNRKKRPINDVREAIFGERGEKTDLVKQSDRGFCGGEIFYLLGRHPACLEGVIGRQHFAAHVVRRQIDDHIVEADTAVIVPMADIAGKDRLPGADGYPGLFHDLPLSRFPQGLSQLEPAAWNSPQTAGGRHPSADEKDAALP